MCIYTTVYHFSHILPHASSLPHNSAVSVDGLRSSKLPFSSAFAMPPPRPKKRSLSDKLKGMRFMQQREESDLRVRLLREQQERQHAAQWTLETTTTSETTPLVLIEPGVVHNFRSPRVGRQSFGKFNTLYEKNTKSDKPSSPSQTPVVESKPIPISHPDPPASTAEHPSVPASAPASKSKARHRPSKFKFQKVTNVPITKERRRHHQPNKALGPGRVTNLSQ